MAQTAALLGTRSGGTYSSYRLSVVIASFYPALLRRGGDLGYYDRSRYTDDQSVNVLAAHHRCMFCSIIGLCVLFGLDAALLAGVGQIWLPRELVWRTFLTCLPWYLGGLIGYNIVSWWVLEPQWKIRCVDMLIGAPLVALCFLTTQPACYIQMFPWLIGLLLCTAFLPLYSIYRFKLGKQ